jgi:hypothetical protein
LRDEKKRIKNNTTHKNNNNNNGNDNTNRCSRVNTKFRESCCVLNVVRYIQYARGEKKRRGKDEKKEWALWLVLSSGLASSVTASGNMGGQIEKERDRREKKDDEEK